MGQPVEYVVGASVVLIAIERLTFFVKAVNAKRNGGDVLELLHQIKELQIENNTYLRSAIGGPLGRRHED